MLVAVDVLLSKLVAPEQWLRLQELLKPLFGRRPSPARAAASAPSTSTMAELGAALMCFANGKCGTAFSHPKVDNDNGI